MKASHRTSVTEEPSAKTLTLFSKRARFKLKKLSLLSISFDCLAGSGHLALPKSRFQKERIFKNHFCLQKLCCGQLVCNQNIRPAELQANGTASLQSKRSPVERNTTILSQLWSSTRCLPSVSIRLNFNDSKFRRLAIRPHDRPSGRHALWNQQSAKLWLSWDRFEAFRAFGVCYSLDLSH